jgi:hypothetical protein
MNRWLPLALALLIPTAAQAGPTLCFSLVDGDERVDVKLVIQPPCQLQPVEGSPRGPSISAVHGVTQGFYQGQETEGFLLAGTCEATDTFVGLVAQALGGGHYLSVSSGTSLEEGNAIYALTLQDDVDPVPCGDLDF